MRSDAPTATGASAGTAAAPYPTPPAPPFAVNTTVAAAGAFASLACATLLLAPIRVFALTLVEKHIAHRPLNETAYWHEQLFWLALCATIFFAVLAILHTTGGTRAHISISRAKRAFPALATALVSLFALTALKIIFTGNAIICDEFYTCNIIAQKWSAIAAAAANDVHPPLYYFLLKIWSLVFGNSVNTLEIYSLVFTLLALVAGGVFLAREFSRRAALLFLLGFNASGTLFFFATEIRMYSQALFLLTMLAITAWNIIKNDRPTPCAYVAFSILLALSAWTHFFAGGFAALIGLLLLLHTWRREPQKTKPLLLAGAGALALFSPWIPHLIAAFSHANTQTTFRETATGGAHYLRCAIEYTSEFFTPLVSTSIGEMTTTLTAGVAGFAWVFVAAFLLPAGGRFLRDFRTAGKISYFSLGILLCPALLFAAFALATLHNVNLMKGRYFFPVFGMLWLFFAIWTTRLTLRKQALIFTFLAAVALTVTHRSAFDFEVRRHDGYNRLLAAIEPRWTKNDLMFAGPTDDNFVHLIRFQKHPEIFSVFVREEIDQARATLSHENSAATSATGGARVAWVWLPTGQPCGDRFRKHFATERPLFADKKSSFARGELYRVSPATRLLPWLEEERRQFALLPPAVPVNIQKTNETQPKSPQ